MIVTFATIISAFLHPSNFEPMFSVYNCASDNVNYFLLNIIRVTSHLVIISAAEASRGDESPFGAA